MKKTSLVFEGPSDLSVGEIRISNGNGVKTKWMATPGQRTFTSESLDPGYYVAEIAPAGPQSQSVVFEVKAGIANTISVPDFSALTASGNGINFLDVADRHAAVQSIYNLAKKQASDTSDQTVLFTPDPSHEPESSPVRETLARPLLTEERVITGPDSKRLSVGLAIEEADKREGWRPFDGPCSAKVQGGRLSIEVSAPADWTAESGRRVRMSVAIQGVRVERLLLPLYRGGTTVNITTSMLSPNDVSLEVLPVDANIRAIWRALEAGTREHAIAVRDHVLKIKSGEPVDGAIDADPWEAMLAGLIFLRFPDEFGKLSPAWAERLCKRHPWSVDVFVIRARQLSNDAGATPQQVLESAKKSVDLLVQAQVRGSPYFNQSNQFFNELIGSLASYAALPKTWHSRAEAARRRWQRESSLQRRAGMSFSWLSRDPVALKQGILAPKRNPSGQLTSRSTAVIFKGLLNGGVIVIESAQGIAPKSAVTDASLFGTETAPQSTQPESSSRLDCPALSRPPGPTNDPNKGRFGGRLADQNFRFCVQFFEDTGRSISLSLTVEAGESITPNIGESVWFCLHPEFNPRWVNVLFRGRTAVLTLRAAGGFTVGVWIPSRKVELECDLATLPDAPKIIREI